MSWFKRKHDYFVSYAHPNGFGCFVIKDFVTKNPRTLHVDLANLIQLAEKLDKVVILNWIKFLKKGGMATMENGIITIAITDLIKTLGYKGIGVDRIDADIFSNQLIIKVSGDCDRYPDTIKPIPPFKAVTGL